MFGYFDYVDLERMGVARGNWRAFAFDAYAHDAAYTIGLVGGLILVAWTFLRRWRLVLLER